MTQVVPYPGILMNLEFIESIVSQDNLNDQDIELVRSLNKQTEKPAATADRIERVTITLSR